MFRVSQHPSSGVLKTVSATSGISHGTGTVTSFHRGLIGTVKIVFLLKHYITANREDRFLIMGPTNTSQMIYMIYLAAIG